MSTKAKLKEDITSYNYRPVGVAGETVTIEYKHGEVYIVRNEKNQLYAVRKEKLEELTKIKS